MPLLVLVRLLGGTVLKYSSCLDYILM